MINEELQSRDFYPEFNFSASRSSGPGGQNVNKVSSKVELRFDVDASVLLTEEEKILIRSKLKSHLVQGDILVINCQEGRSQVQNKEKCIKKFYELLQKAFKRTKPRKPTKPSKASVQERLKKKKLKSVIKTQRQQKNNFGE